ncbi:MAG: MATE family efflux transporter, partial [Saprospiraceae bacterium]|nr:MATE family efflux transporter [Saprospiraceae bacterium]
IPAMGAEGAAIATSIGRGIGVLYQLWMLFGKQSIIKLKKAYLAWDWELIKRLLDIAWSGALQFIIASASWIFLMRIISEFGNEVTAGYTFAIRILVFTILPSWGLSNAAATLVGQNLGAKKPRRAELSVWLTARYNMYFLLTVSIIYFVFAKSLIGIFTSDPLVLKAGVDCLRIISVGYVFFAYGMVISQAFNGAGDTKTPTWMNLFCFWMLEIPLAYLLALHWNIGPEGVYIAIALSESVLALIAILIFRKGKWKLKEV